MVPALVGIIQMVNQLVKIKCNNIFCMIQLDYI